MDGLALEASSWLHASALPLSVTVLVSLLFLAVTIYLLQPDHETPPSFSVPSPDLTPGPVLDATSLRASSSTAIQCYAPATGRFLGHVNPTTERGIDRAIKKAEVAQKNWAPATTFSDRRRILKTLLKSVMLLVLGSSTG